MRGGERGEDQQVLHLTTMHENGYRDYTILFHE